MNKRIIFRALGGALPVVFLFAICRLSRADGDLPQDVPLVNPGFEAGLVGWAVEQPFVGQVAIESSVVHGGAKAVEIDATTKNNTPFVVGRVSNLEGGATYTFSVWARAAPGSPAVPAAIKLENYNAAANTSGLYSFVTLPAEGSWKQISVTEQTDADTIRSELLLRVFGKGAVIFDDAAFAMTAHSADLSVIAPRATAIEPGQGRRLTYQLVFRQPWAGPDLPDISANLQPMESSQNAPTPAPIRALVARAADSRHYDATIEVPRLDARDYFVNFDSHADGKLLRTDFPAYLFAMVSDRQPKNLTASGTILWHGKPFFPIGMYHPLGEADYRLLAENGFNAVQGGANPNLDQFGAALDAAQRCGLAVDVPLYNARQVKKNLPNSLEKIRRFGHHPAVLCWKILDEPQITMSGGTASEVPEAYRALKAADPDHPLELTLDSQETAAFWGGFCDMAQTDSYPLPRFPLTQVADYARNVKSAMRPWQNLTVVLQCGWTPDLRNQPTVDQARCMVYQALINGAKGIFWYSMHDPGWDLTKTPLWPHMKAINEEIESISQPIMLGDDVPLQIDNHFIQAGAKSFQNKLYIFVTNPSEKEQESLLSFSDLPALSSGAILGSSGRVTVGHSANGTATLSLKLEPLESYTMSFDLAHR